MAEMTENEINKRPREAIFKDISAEDSGSEISEIESLCLNCEDQGTTRLFLTKIPFFREVVVSSFSCDHCGYRNTEVMPASVIQGKGVCFEITVSSLEDLNRQVVQTHSATLSIPELDFEAPPNKGVLTTIEGILTRIMEGLQQEQPIRKALYPEDYEKIEIFLKKVEELKSGQKVFHLVVDDPSGNSFIENPHSPEKDPHLVITYYRRTKEQDVALGVQTEDDEDDEVIVTSKAREEVSCFDTLCSNCSASVQTKMVLINLPHFKETIIIATVCEACGHRENEVKGGGGFEPLGTKITLKITNMEDLKRDVIKSDTSSVKIPELDFDTDMGTMGGKLTTIEGLLLDIKERLEANPFVVGDSSDNEQKSKVGEFCKKIDQIVSAELSVHFVLDDPAGNSFIQSLDGSEPDSALEILKYERTFEQNEELGLNDLKTENYEAS